MKCCRSVGFGVGFLVLQSLVFSQASSMRLQPGRTYKLESQADRVDQILLAAGGRMVTRTSDFEHPQNQAIKVFSDQGKFLRKIGAFGPGPGQYDRLLDLALDPQGVIWSVDISSRLSAFDSSDGRLIRTVLTNQPPIAPRAMVFDSRRSGYFICGEEPDRRGKRWIHFINAKSDQVEGSWMPQDPVVARDNLFPFTTCGIALNAQLNVIYRVNGVLNNLYVLDVASGAIKTVPINSHKAHRVKALTRTEVYDHPLLDRILAESDMFSVVMLAGDYLLVGVERGRSGWLGQVFHAISLLQVGEDIPLPGKPVGVRPDGSLVFARQDPGQVVLVEARLVR